MYDYELVKRRISVPQHQRGLTDDGTAVRNGCPEVGRTRSRVSRVIGRKNNLKDTIIICISNAHRDDAHALTLFFSFSDLTSSHINVTPPGQGCRFLYRIYFVLVFFFFFNVKFEMQDCVGRLCRDTLAI